MNTNTSAGGAIEEVKQQFSSAVSRLYIQNITIQSNPSRNPVYTFLGSLKELGFTSSGAYPNYWAKCLKPCTIKVGLPETPNWALVIEKGDLENHVIESWQLQSLFNTSLTSITLEPNFQYRLKGTTSESFETARIAYFVLPT